MGNRQPGTASRRPVNGASVFRCSFAVPCPRFLVFLVFSSAFVAILGASPSAWAQTQGASPAPTGADATITFTVRSAAFAVGFAWGAGTLEYHGQRYPVRVDGMAIGAAGAASMSARGVVYHLKRPEDLNGEFTALGAGLEIGRGANRLRMRNAKGVVIDFVAEGRGIQIGLGPRAIMLQVGAAGGPPASAEFVLPKTLGFGEAAFGPLSLQPTLNAQLAGFAEGNAGFGGKWAAGPINKSDLSMEHSNEVGLNALADLGSYGALYGRVSGVFSLSGGGVDPGATSFPDFNTNAYTLEAAFLSWRSGNALPGLGYNVLQLGYGNQNYQVFDGLLFWQGAAACGVRGACWLAPRNAFREAGTVRFKLADWLVEGFHLKFNDDPSTNTRTTGGRIQYVLHDWIVRDVKSGFMYFNIYESDEPSRDGLNGFYFYQDATPVPLLPDFQYTTSFVAETNSAAVGNAQAYGWFVAPAYTVSQLPWSPQLSYRFASFSGGGTRNFDALFTGSSDWGYWAQGELLGEWVLPNSNLHSHMVRLRFTPDKFLLADLEESFGPTPMRVSSHQLADEVDAILDIAATNWWSMTVDFTLAVPNTGFREATGGNATWINSMLYTNFNF
jgi:hypothetical protein